MEQLQDIFEQILKKDPDVKDLTSPYAGFYANLVGVDRSTAVMFLAEFATLFVMGLIMYGFYVRERHLKSKINFTIQTEVSNRTSQQKRQRPGLSHSHHEVDTNLK